MNNATLAVAFTSAPLSKALTGGLRVTTGSKNSTGKIGFKNEGYWGIDVRVQKYTGSFWVKGDYNMTFTVALASNLTNETFATVEVPSQSNATRWTEHTFELTPSYNASNSNNTFSVTFDPAGTDKGTLDFNLISLFPPTYKNRTNGLRVDIAQALADMNPVSQLQTLAVLSNSINTNNFSTSSASPAATCSKVSPTIHTGTGKKASARSKTAQASKVYGATNKPTALG